MEGLALGGWATRRSHELLEVLDRLNTSIQESDQAVEREAKSRADAMLLTRQMAVGPVTALAFVLTIGPASRFPKKPAGGELSGAESEGGE